MSVKIKISYTTDKELAGMIRLLSPVLKTYKARGKRKKTYLNAYADIDDIKLMDFINDAE